LSRAVLVTGGGSGIGLATAIDLARRGFRVFASVVDDDQREAVKHAAQDHGVELRALSLDVTRPADAEQAVRSVIEATGGIYGVVHSAGSGLRGFFEDLSDREIRDLFAVNVFGVMTVTRAALPALRAAGEGRIVILGSSAGRIPSMTLSGYAASKFAVEGFAESLAQEVGPLGIGVSVIEPGIVMTPHFTVNRGRARAAIDPAGPYYRWFCQHERMVDAILETRRITPEQVAEVVGRAMTDRRPRLRYVVGWRVKLFLAARKLLPGETFERVYRYFVVRRVTRPRTPAASLSELSLRGVTLDPPGK
jgi:NAD(P)-dependent dehydrogenase (short-subunit alcohol dehydrogenase family)